jgi:hypothetical protein
MASGFKDSRGQVIEVRVFYGFIEDQDLVM